MSLNWDISAVKDGDELCWVTAPEDMPMHGIKAGERVMNPVTNALIWATISVDLRGISKDNAAEFFARLRFTERVNGPFLIRAEVDGKRPEGSAAWITPKEVADHIGLVCNVTPLTRAQWLKKFSVELDRDMHKFKAVFSEVVA